MLKIFTPLSDAVEKLIYDTIGCCIAVHDELGPGMREIVYSRATAIELRAKGIPFEREKPYAVTYRGERICEQRLDFVVGGEIVLEIKPSTSSRMCITRRYSTTCGSRSCE